MIYRKVVKRGEIEAMASLAEVKAHLAYRSAELLQEAGAPVWAKVFTDNDFDTDDITLAVKWPEEEVAQ